MKNWLGIFCCTCLLAISASAAETDSATTAPATSPASAPTGGGLTARVKMTTTLGDIVVELDGERAPISVLNFLRYVDEKHYEGTIFHRIIPTFMIQGGGYTEEYVEKPTHEQIKNEWRNGLKNVRGTIAMARLPVPDSATAQFFINVVDNPFLDEPQPDGQGYAVFGKVVEGMDVADKIKDVPTREEPAVGNAPAPITPVVIEKIEIIEDVDREAVKQQISKADQIVAEAEMKAAETLKAAQAVQIEELTKKYTEEAAGKATTTESGLQFFTTKEGTGASPTDNDAVKVHFEAMLPDGTKVATTRTREEARVFPMSGIQIKGLTEGLKLMKAGGTAKMILPPALAAGDKGQGMIPPKSYVVFDVELLEVNPAQPGQ